MNNTNRFDNMELYQLKRIYSAIQHKRENLQKEISIISGYSDVYGILPRNFDNIPELRNVPIKLLGELKSVNEECFDAYWAMQKKEAEESGELEVYWASKKLYSFRETLSDDEFFSFMDRASSKVNSHLTTHKVIRLLMDYPNFIEEVVADGF